MLLTALKCRRLSNTHLSAVQMQDPQECHTFLESTTRGDVEVVLMARLVILPLHSNRFKFSML